MADTQSYENHAQIVPLYHRVLTGLLLLILIGTCISFTFLNRFSHQSNLMVMRPGGYSSATFVRFGIPLTAVSMLTAFGVGWALLAV